MSRVGIERSLTHIARPNDRKAGGSARPLSSIKPEKGSIIVSNWSSWIDVLYLAILFNPTFLAPVVAPAPHAGSAQASPSRPGSSGSAKSSPAATRRRNAGASVVEEVNNSPGSLGPSSRLLGFRQVSLWDMLRLSGETPMVREDKNGKQVFKDIVSLAEKASGPVCIFPEVSSRRVPPDRPLDMLTVRPFRAARHVQQPRPSQDDSRLSNLLASNVPCDGRAKIGRRPASDLRRRYQVSSAENVQWFLRSTDTTFLLAVLSGMLHPRLSHHLLC